MLLFVLVILSAAVLGPHANGSRFHGAAQTKWVHHVRLDSTASSSPISSIRATTIQKTDSNADVFTTVLFQYYTKIRNLRHLFSLTSHLMLLLLTINSPKLGCQYLGRSHATFVAVCCFRCGLLHINSPYFDWTNTNYSLYTPVLKSKFVENSQYPPISPICPRFTFSSFFYQSI